MPGAVSPLLAAKAEKAWKRRKAAKKAVKKASKMTSTEAARHKNSQVAAASSQATSTGSSSNTKSFGSAKVQGTTTFTAPTLSETTKNLSNAAKNGSTTQNTPAQNISIPLFDNHQPVKNEGGNLSSASSTKSNSVLSRGILGAAQGNEAATIKNNTTGRTFVNSRGETVKVDAPQKPSLSERMSNATKGKILTPGASYAHDIQEEKEYKEGLEGATKITRYDDLTVGHGGILEGSSAEDHIKKDDEKEMQDNVDLILSNQDALKNPEEAAEYLAYVAGFNEDTQGFILRTYYAADGDQKLKILNGILASAGWTRQTEYLYDSLSSEEQEKADKMRIAAIGGGNYEAGKEKLDDYDEAVAQSKADEYEKNWAKENYTFADVIVDTIARKFSGFGAANNDAVGFTAADVVTNDRKLTSPLHGVNLVKNDLLTNATAIGKNFINFFMYEIEKTVAAGENIYGNSELFDDLNKKIYDWGTNLNSDYRRESRTQQIRADAINLTETEKIINNIAGYVTQMAPVIALSAIDPAAGMAALGTTSGGQYARQAYDSGASVSESVNYGILGGLLEAGTEKMLTGIGWFGKGIGNTVAEKTGISLLRPSTVKVLEGFKSSTIGRAFEYFVHAGAEASEEMVGQALQSYLQRATYDPDAKNATLKDIAAAGGYGAVVSGLLGLPQTALGVTSAAADSASAKEYTNQMKEMAATQISNIQELVKSKQISPIQARSAIKQITDSVQKSIAKVSGSRTAASAQQGNTNNFVEPGASQTTVNSAMSGVGKTQEEAVADFQKSPYGAALSYFAANGVTVSPEEAELVYQAYLNDSSGEYGSELTPNSGDQGGTGQSVDSAADGVDSSANKSGATAPPHVVAAQEESAEEDSPHVVSSQEEALAELRKVAATKKPGEWISVVKVNGKGAVKYTALVSATHDIQQVQSGVADPAVYKNSRGKQTENQAANELKTAGNGGIISTTGETAAIEGAGDVGKIITEVKYTPSSGAILKANPNKTTTILGSFDKDMKNIVNEMGNVKSTDFGAKKGGFNVLNVPDELYDSDTFWDLYNKPWLDEAINRGDDIVLATKPQGKVMQSYNKITGKWGQSGFSREYQYLCDNGYHYDSTISMMVK